MFIPVELKKLFEIEGYDDGRAVGNINVTGFIRYNGVEWVNSCGGICDKFINKNWNESTWSLYKEPNDDIEEITHVFSDGGQSLLKSKINELAKKVNELSKVDNAKQ